MPHARAHIRFNNTDEATNFVARLNRDFPTGRYTIENFDGTSRINARSIFGVIYAMAEHDGRAPDLGSGSREFESRRPDQALRGAQR